MVTLFAWTFLGGKLIDNFAAPAPPAGATGKEHVFTVPTGKRWLVFGGYFERDANASFTIGIYNSDDKILFIGVTLAAGTTNLTWGMLNTTGNVAYKLDHPIPLKAGDYIKYVWGAAQTSPEVTLVVAEIDAP